ncbi:MAG TPA: metal ABC transporter ATP-binding protein [bacterium]|nr:metal ABC transporter ATP-binding protein [bacterium]
MGKILTVKNLSVSLDGEPILEGIDFSVDRGQTLVILGPNGAGKTILLKALAGLLPHRGEVTWSEDVVIGYVPQRVPLDKDLPVTVQEFFGLKRIGPAEAAKVLQQVGIEDPSFLKREIGKISSGQFQRVLIAWALAGDPNALLFDEPMAGIDVGGEETVYELLQKVQKERRLTVLLVTHELTAVYRQATNILCLNKKMICFGPPTEILTPANLQEVFGKGTKYFLHDHG